MVETHFHREREECNVRCKREDGKGNREYLIAPTTKEPLVLDRAELAGLMYTAIDLNPVFKGECAGEVLEMWKRTARNMTVTVRLKAIHDAVQRGMTGGVYLFKFSVNGEKIAEVKVVP